MNELDIKTKETLENSCSCFPSVPPRLPMPISQI